MGKTKGNGNIDAKSKKRCELSSESWEMIKTLSKKIEFLYDVILNNEIKCKLIDSGIELDQIDFAISSIRSKTNSGKSFEDAFNEFLAANESIFSTEEEKRAERVQKIFLTKNPELEKYLKEV